MHLSPALRRLAAQLLDLAADSYANHGCNDFALPSDLSQADLEALALEINRDREPGDLETAQSLRKGVSNDAILMSLFARALREPSPLDAARADLGAAVCGLAVQHRGCRLVLAQSGSGWVAEGTASVTDPDGGRYPIIIAVVGGQRSTPREALDACAAEIERLKIDD